MFVVYKSVNELFLSEKDLSNQNNKQELNRSSLNQAKDSDIIVNSNIISFKMNNKKDAEFLKQVPIELTFKHILVDDNLQLYQINPVCSYWNYNKKFLQCDINLFVEIN